MRKFVGSGLSTVFMAVLLVTLPAAARPQSDAAGTIPVTTVVTALGSKFSAPPAVSKATSRFAKGVPTKTLRIGFRRRAIEPASNSRS